MSNRRTIEFVSESEDQTLALGERLGRTLRAGDLVALHGELGAGKTCLVRGIAQGMTIDPAHVHSPTFVIVNIYEPKAKGSPLVHIDAYRLRDRESLEPLGWDRLLDGSNIVVIEWAERIGHELQTGDARFDITLEHAGENARRLRIEMPADREAMTADSAAPPPIAAKCRTCRGAVAASSKSAPFCSERCRLADLNKWFSGEHKISRPLRDDDEE